MIKKVKFEYRGKDFLVIFKPDGFGYWGYTIYLLKVKKHWWNFSKSYVCSGGTLWWDDDADPMEQIKKRLDSEYQIIDSKNSMDNKIMNL